MIIYLFYLYVIYATKYISSKRKYVAQVTEHDAEADWECIDILMQEHDDFTLQMRTNVMNATCLFKFIYRTHLISTTDVLNAGRNYF